MSSPTFKNLKTKQKQSPVEIKEKMRKNYKEKVQNCREMLLNRFRGSGMETDLRNTLSGIYKNMFAFTDEELDNEENTILEDVKKELIQEELEWWRQEYEKSQMENVDWSSIEEDKSVICPLCQKTNLTLQNNILTCPHCKCTIKTQKSLAELKNCFVQSVERHSSVCNNEVQFTLVPDNTDSHIYLICDMCMEMQLLV